jgi:hypothetical protein
LLLLHTTQAGFQAVVCSPSKVNCMPTPALNAHCRQLLVNGILPPAQWRVGVAKG